MDLSDPSNACVPATDSNAFTALPDNLGGCLALLSLSARHNQLTSVTGKIFTAKTITALHLDHNKYAVRCVRLDYYRLEY